MSPTTRNQQKKRDEEQAHPYGAIDDRVSDYTPLYPVFCTANIPSPILGDFIDQAYEGAFDMVGEDDPNGVCGSPCILQTIDLDSITHGSRKPMPDFKSPFLGMTDNEIRDWMRKNPHPNFAQLTFTILDQNAVERGISRIGYTDINEEDPDDRMLWADFFADLYVRVPIEMATMSWYEQDEIGTGEVFDRKAIDLEKQKVEKRDY